MNKYKYLYLVFCIAIIGCKSEIKHSAPDVSAIEVNFDLIRIDQLVSQMDTSDLSNELDLLMHKHPSAATLYFGTLNPMTASTNLDTIAAGLKVFLADPFVKNLQDTIQLVFDDMNEIKSQYIQAYKYLKYYIPNADIANVYTMNTLFNYQRFLFSDDDESNALGVGLDLFLGSDYPYKKIDPQNPSFSKYLTRSFNKDHLVKKSVEVLVDDIIGDAPGVRMIDQMIHNGKRLYILDKIFPSLPDSIITEYTSEQMDWVNNNKLEMWSYFFDQELFYETNLMKINKYLTPSPNSPGMPATAPGRTANFMGWQIVKAYMRKFPETTMMDLIQHNDAQKMLELSKYKP